MRIVRPEVRFLAAMQTVAPSVLTGRGLTIDIANADPEILKLALIVVGLNKDIQNLLHPKHVNGEIVRALGQHDDSIVRQYSVWAVIEKRALTIDHLGLSFANIDAEPQNVQSKLLELGASNIRDLTQRQDLIIQGSNLSSIDAQEGLAKGLVRSYYDGLEGVALGWFDTDDNRRVQLLLAEHFARYSEQVPSYREKAFELVERDSDFRERVLLGSEGRPLFGEIKRLEAENSIDLFSGTSDDQPGMLAQTIRRQNQENVLVLNATPETWGPLRVDVETARVEEQLEMVRNRRRNLHLIPRFAVRTDQIQKELFNHEPKILHFSGHGVGGNLIFEHRDGSPAPLQANALAGLLSAYGRLECLILHACYSEDVARTCLKHVDVIIGSTDAIKDITAPPFSCAFYQALANGRSYTDAFKAGTAEVAITNSMEAAKYKIFLRER